MSNTDDQSLNKNQTEICIDKKIKKWLTFTFNLLDASTVSSVAIDVDREFWNVFNYIKVIMVNAKSCICSSFLITRVSNERMNPLKDKIPIKNCKGIKLKVFNILLPQPFFQTMRFFNFNFTSLHCI